MFLSLLQILIPIFQRRFALETGELLTEGDEPVETENVSVTGAESEERPAKKKRKGKKRGRVAEGEDFWGRMDLLFHNKTEEWGDDYNHPAWKRYVRYYLSWLMLIRHFKLH